MIKLRVEWHRSCPECGTNLVADYFDDSEECRVCPWCGCVQQCDPPHRGEDVSEYLLRAVQNIEDEANAKVTVRR